MPHTGTLTYVLIGIYLRRYIVSVCIQVKQCQRAAVVIDTHQEMNICLSSEETDNDSCVTSSRQSNNLLVGDLHCLLPQHWTSLTDSQVDTPSSCASFLFC